MARRNRKNPGLFNMSVAGAAAVSLLAIGWYGARVVMRKETAKTFRQDYSYDNVKKVADTARALGYDIKLPTADEFAKAMVPWTTPGFPWIAYNTPYTAVEDILDKGRKSVYWPKGYKKGAASAKAEPIILKAMSGAYYTPEGASNKEMVTAAVMALLKK